jgi:flagellar biosynthetic protein FliQ
MVRNAIWSARAPPQTFPCNVMCRPLPSASCAWPFRWASALPALPHDRHDHCQHPYVHGYDDAAAGDDLGAFKILLFVLIDGWYIVIENLCRASIEGGYGSAAGHRNCHAQLYYTASSPRHPAPGLVVGLLISIFQTVTQIREMTLTFIPKIAAVMLVLLFTIPWMLNLFNEYVAYLMNIMRTLIE